MYICGHTRTTFVAVYFICGQTLLHLWSHSYYICCCLFHLWSNLTTFVVVVTFVVNYYIPKTSSFERNHLLASVRPCMWLIKVFLGCISSIVAMHFASILESVVKNIR